MTTNDASVNKNLMTKEQFLALLQDLQLPDQALAVRARARWNNLSKPLASFGQLELMHQRLAAIAGSSDPEIKPRAVFVFGADNGIEKSRINPAPNLVAPLLRSIAANTAIINILGRQNETTVIPVNLGVRDLSDEDGIVHIVINPEGTENFAQTEAMNEAEMMLAIQLGYELALRAIQSGYKLLIAGEAGSANAASATAVLAALEETDAASICSREPGLSDDMFLRKQEIIAAAVKKHDVEAGDPLQAVHTFGGFDLAAMMGFYAAAALNKVPIILDGLISQVAAVVLHKLQPNISHYLFAAHKTSEPGCELALRSLGLTSILDLDIFHGEGSGAVIALPLMDSAIEIYRESALLDDGVDFIN